MPNVLLGMAMNELIEYGPPTAFFTGGAIAAWFVLKYNLITSRIAQEIEKIARTEGKEWVLNGNFERMLRFLFNPNSLIESCDSSAVVAAKTRLIKHRSNMWVSIRRAVIALLIGLIVSVSIPITAAFVLR